MSLKAILTEVDKLEVEATASGNTVLVNIAASIRSHVAAIAGDIAGEAEKVQAAAAEVQADQSAVPSNPTKPTQ